MTDVIKKAENLIPNKRIVVDGIASIDDSADYPIQDIKIKGNPAGTVTGDVTVNLAGKQLIPLTSSNNSVNNYKLDVENNIMHLYMKDETTENRYYGTFGIDNRARIANYGDYLVWAGQVLKAGTYTLSIKYISGTTSSGTSGGNNARCIVYGRTIGDTGRVRTNLAQVYLATHDDSVTFTLSEDMEINIAIYVYGVSAIDFYFKAQLEIGTVATRYEPYTCQTQLLSFGLVEIVDGDIIQRIDDVWYLNETPISNETLVAQLNTLRLLDTYKGTTNFVLLGDNGITPILEVTYKQDLDTRISDIENAIVALGANV